HDIVFALKFAWRSYRPRNRGPSGLNFAVEPLQANIGLDLKARIVLLLEFGAERELQTIGDKRDAILHEGAHAFFFEPRSAGADDACVFRLVARPSIVETGKKPV